MKRNRNKRSHVSKVRGHLGHYAHARRHYGHGHKFYKRYGKNHMILYAEKKKAMIASVVAIAVLIAVKWFAIGYTIGKRAERLHH